MPVRTKEKAQARSRPAASRSTLVRSSRRRGGVHLIIRGHVRGGHAAPIEIGDHPETGACYFLVMPTRSSVMTEHAAGWTMNERPWLKIIDTSTFQAIFPQFRERRAVFCTWLMLEAPWLPKDRRATVAPIYAEALDDNIGNLMPQHRLWLNTFLRNASSFDAVLGHTPWMAKKLSDLSGLRSAVMPAGYEARVLGEPQWTARKTWDAAWYGTMVGKRSRLVARLKSRLGSGLVDLTGQLAGSLVAKLQSSKTVLYLCHSDVRSYSTWRTWHAMSSSAAIVTEPGDYWPLDPSSCIEIPRVHDGNVDEIARRLKEIDPAHALEVARAAREQLSKYTVSHVIDEYLVKSTAAWLR